MNLVKISDQHPAEYTGNGIRIVDMDWDEENTGTILKVFFEDRGIKVGAEIFHIYQSGKQHYALKTDYIEMNNWWREKARSSGMDVYRAPKYQGHFRYARQFVLDNYEQFIAEHSVALTYDSVRR